MHLIFKLFFVFILLLFNSCSQNSSERELLHLKPLNPYDYTIEYDADWSPDGNSIVFMHYDTSWNSGLYTINLIDSSYHIIVYSNSSIQDPKWSKDGQWIAFSDEGQIWRIKSNGDSLIRITSNGLNSSPTWSNEGKTIYYSNYDRSSNKDNIWKTSILDTSRAICLTCEYASVSSRYPNYNKSKNTIEFSLFDTNTGFSKIVSMDTTGSNLKIIFSNTNYNLLPKSSNDGTSILFISDSLYSGKYELRTISNEGGELKRLANTQLYSCSWSPDGGKIVYTSSDVKNSRLWIIDADGTNNKQLTKTSKYEQLIPVDL